MAGVASGPSVTAVFHLVGVFLDRPTYQLVDVFSGFSYQGFLSFSVVVVVLWVFLLVGILRLGSFAGVGNPPC